MDNALIDDRRIHVDFSQSVSKLWSQYRRKDSQMSKGGGCFKCGALDHIAKDCSSGGPATNQPPKYILKDDNAARGGDNNYEMVFDGNDPESPMQGKQHGDNDSIPDDRAEKQKTNMPRPHDVKYRDQPKKHESYRQTHRRDMDYLEEQRDKEKLTERRRERDDRRDERKDYRKRSGEHGDDAHEDRRRGSGDYKKRSSNDDYLEEKKDKEKLMEKRRERGDRRDERTDYRKRSADYDAREDRRGNADSGTGGSRNELSHRKRTIDNDSDKNRREERDHRRRVTESDDDYDRRHRHYRNK